MNNNPMWSLTVASLLVLGLASMPGEAKTAPDRELTITSMDGHLIADTDQPGFHIGNLSPGPGDDDCWSNLTNQLAFCAACAQWGSEWCSGCLDKAGVCKFGSTYCECSISCRVCTQSGERMRADIF